MVSLDTAYSVENWKHYSKIIFKGMNSVVGPIFNESFIKKKVCDSQEQYMESLESTKRASQWRKEKKKKNAETQTHCVLTVPKLVLRIQFLCLTEPRRC